MRLLKIAAFIAGLLAPALAFGQAALLQSGSWTAGHLPMFASQGLSQPIVIDSGPAGGGGNGYGVSELLLVARGAGTAPYAGQGTGPLGSTFCSYDAPITNSTGYHYICMSPNSTTGGAVITTGAGGAASPLGFSFVVNGTSYAFPFSSAGITGPGSSTVGHLATWNSTSGAALADSATVTSAFIAGVSTNSNASAGLLGEYASSSVAVGSAVSLTTATPANVTSLSLTAGDWDCNGNVINAPAGSTTVTSLEAWISTTTAAVPTLPNAGAYAKWQAAAVTAGVEALTVGPVRISLAGTTTVYLSAQSAFGVSSNGVYGFIGCRRAR
jgi:hypothetical protein